VSAADLFRNYNLDPVEDGPREPTAFTLKVPSKITGLETYHWNGSHGVKAGTIGLKDKDGKLYGPFPAEGTTNWIATAEILVPPGTYTVIDSDPATWSHNSASGFLGFVAVHGSDDPSVAAMSMTTAAGPPSPPETTQFPLDARLLAESPGALSKESHQVVEVRNTTSLAGSQGISMPLQAVVIRGVEWTEGPADEKIWNGPLKGSTRELPDGTVEHHFFAQSMTGLAFEEGLLLPGQKAIACATSSRAVMPGRFRVAGRMMSMRVPSPGAVRTPICPPCAWTIP
jgi:hypothetical protein